MALIYQLIWIIPIAMNECQLESHYSLMQRFSTFFHCGPPISIFLHSVDPLLLTVIQNFESCGP